MTSITQTLEDVSSINQHQRSVLAKKAAKRLLSMIEGHLYNSNKVLRGEQEIQALESQLQELKYAQAELVRAEFDKI